MSEFSYYMLIADLVMNLIGVALGGVLVVKAKDNYLKLFWGILLILCSLNMLIDNLGWLDRFMVGYGMNERSSLLIFSRMLKWFFFAHILSLFPVASLRPGWLTWLRIIIFSLPLILFSLICICYIWFNGYITEVYTIKEVFLNLDKTDIQIRLIYFFISLLVPALYFMIPFGGKWITLKRRLKSGMYFYTLGWFIILVLYVLFVTGTTDTVFSIYGFMVTFLPNVFSVFYLFDENPLSLHREKTEITQQEEKEYHKVQVSPQVYAMQEKMSDYVKTQTPFLDPNYSLEQLASDLNTNKSMLVKTIQYAGFTGFNEYINYMRLEHFKVLALSSPGSSIKELMYGCGFTSRSSFYRRFAEQENMSPKEYIERNQPKNA